MSATHYGCGCVVSHDGEGQIASVAPCARHQWMLQPELDGFHARLLELRALEAERDAEPPDIEVVVVREDPIDLIRSIFSGCTALGTGEMCHAVRVRDDVNRCSHCGREWEA